MALELEEPTESLPQEGRVSGRAWVTVGLMLGMLLAAMESTVVSTAMPTVIHDLHGIALYPWVLSAYLLTSTTTVPIYGKMADLFGRRRVFLAATVLFLMGSMLSGAAHSMEQLIAFRAFQGIGAGGVLPLTLTIIGDLYPLKERARVQALFTAIWSTASLGGPLIGAALTEHLSWRWVFYVNAPFGIASLLLVGGFLRENRTADGVARIDTPGVALLTGGVFALLMFIQRLGQRASLGSLEMLALLAVTVALIALFLWQENRAEEPMLPLTLFRRPVLLTAFLGNVLIGVTLYAMDSFMPLFMQGVRGGTPSAAGVALTPLVLAWALAAYFAARLLPAQGFRRLSVFGGGCIFLASLSLMASSPQTPAGIIVLTMALLGIGLGPCSMAFLVSAQNAVDWSERGVVTASSLFFRTLGGAVGVGVLGAVLNAQMSAQLSAAHLAHFDPNDLLNAAVRANMSAQTLVGATGALAGGLHAVFCLLALLALLGLVGIAIFSRSRSVASGS